MVICYTLERACRCEYYLATKLREERDNQIELNSQLQTLIEEIKTLQGILPICSRCKKIRDDNGYWQQVEVYIANNSEAKFSHGICKTCSDELYGDQDWYGSSKKR